MDIGALFSSPDWGTVPDWFAAVGTISAVCVALAFGFRDSKRLASTMSADIEVVPRPKGP